jgi:ribosomal protein L16 Arg81 hydroxylase
MTVDHMNSASLPHRVTDSKRGSDELRTLLAPITPAAFLQNYWQIASLYIQGAPDKLQGLFSRERFDAVVARASEANLPPTFQIHAMMRGHDDNPLDPTPMTMERIDREDIDELLARGVTICVNDISAADDRLAAYARAIKAQLMFVGNVRFNCYLSPANSGADLHFDARVSTTLQIEGRKRWRFAQKPAVAWPLSNAQCGWDGVPIYVSPWAGTESWEQLSPVPATDMSEIVLEPGDVLCLPAGTWHEAKAHDEGSLALNLTFGSLSFFNVLAMLLEPTLLKLADWRGGLPPVYDESVQSDSLAPEVAQYLDERMQEIRLFAEQFNPQDPHVQQLWRKLAQRS